MAKFNPLVAGGMGWEKIPCNHPGEFKYASENSYYEILQTKQGKYRLISFEHSPSSQFPSAEFWMMEFSTLESAAKQAEMM